MKRFRQSLYPVVYRTAQAVICGFAVYIALSALFYGDLLMVCGGEYFAATLFAVSLGALVLCIGLIDDLRVDVYTHAESVGFAAHGRVPALSTFVDREEILRVSYTAGPLARLLKTRKLQIVTASFRRVIYLKLKDVAAVCTCLPEPFAKHVMQTEGSREKEGMLFGFSVAEGVRVFAKVFFIGLALLITVYPAAVGICLGNGITLRGVLGGMKFAGKAFALFGISVGALAALALLCGGLKLLLLALPMANYTFRKEGGWVTVGYGRAVLRLHAMREDRLRMVRTTRFFLSPVSALKTVTLYFAEGSRRLVLPLACRALTAAECEGVAALFPDFNEGEFSRLALARFMPTVAVFTVCAFLPTVLFAWLESWLVLWLTLPFALVLWRITRNRSAACTEQTVSVRAGIFGCSVRTVKKADVSCVRVFSGGFCRPFLRCVAEIRLKDTETAVEIAGLTREEGENALFLAKHTKK